MTGHRYLPDDFDRIKLKIYLGQIAENGYEIFLVGMAKGFDLECFSVLTGHNYKYLAELSITRLFIQDSEYCTNNCLLPQLQFQ